jgi:plastocyanin
MPFASRSYTRQAGCPTGASLLWLAFCGTTVFAYGQSRSQQHIVLTEAVAFLQKTIEVKVGDTIVWKNKATFPHTVTADNGQFRSGDVAPEQTGKITVGKQGRFPYVCTLHSGMTGVVNVK